MIVKSIAEQKTSQVHDFKCEKIKGMHYSGLFSGQVSIESLKILLADIINIITKTSLIKLTIQFQS